MTAPGDIPSEPPPPEPSPPEPSPPDSSPAKPSPPEPGHELPESELPQLTFPNSDQYQFRKAAEERRKLRIRNEVLFCGLAVVIGLGVWVAAHTPAFAVMALISVLALAAYEMTIATLE